MGIPRSIPSVTKRRLRREAGFGCCVCGNPFFEFHHIAPFSSTQSHAPMDMMVLCPNHHHEATVGALTVSEQRSWKARPFNITRGYANGQLAIADPCLAIQIATNQFVGQGIKLLVDNEPLLQLDSDSGGRVSVSLNLFDQSGALMAMIHRNEWISGDPLPWDLEFGHRWIRLRDPHGRQALSLDARKTPIELTASLWCNNQHFDVRGECLVFNGVVREVSLKNLALVGMLLAADTAAESFALKPDPQFGRGTLVSWPDVPTRMRMAFDAYAQLSAGGR